VEEIEFHGPKDYLDLARSENASEDQLRALAGSEYSFVILAVAKHPATPADVLSTLVPKTAASWNDDELMLALVNNEKSSRDVLVRIAKLVPSRLHERDAPLAFKAGVALARRVDTPDPVLLDMLASPAATTQFRKVVARETTHVVVLESLAEDRSETVRRAAHRRADTTAG